MQAQSPDREWTDAELLELVLQHAQDVDGKRVLSCRKAFELAQQHGIPIGRIGAVCDKPVVRIVHCQLGCFD